MGPVETSKFELNDENTTALFGEGMKNAIAGLSKMVNKEIAISEIKYKKVRVKDIPSLYGGSEAEIVGVYLAISGYSQGHMLVVYQPQTAYDLIDMLLGQPVGSTNQLSEMELSVLGEVGNIMGSFFLNRLADSTGRSFKPSPPAVMMDMAGAILDVAVASILEYCDYTYVLGTTFGTADCQVAGAFLVIPVSAS
jgi:chemotaxis protein CheC